MSHTSKKEVFPTIIAARPGVIQESLRATLTTFPRVEVIASAGDLSTLLELVETRQPALLVLDHGLVAEEKIATLLRQLKGREATLQCLVLADTDSQGLKFLNAGAAGVLLRDDPSERWHETLDELAAGP